MVYMGSKNRIAKELIPIITEYLKPNQWYVEPFVGGANMIDKIEHPYNNSSLKFEITAKRLCAASRRVL